MPVASPEARRTVSRGGSSCWGTSGLVEEVAQSICAPANVLGGRAGDRSCGQRQGSGRLRPRGSGLERDAGRLERGGRLLFERAREPGQPGRAVRTRGG